MKAFLFLLLLANTAIANEAIDCKLTDGIYENSEPPIKDLKLGTISNVFSIRNATVLSFTLENQPYRLLRTNINVDKYTKLDFELRRDRKIFGSAKVVLNITPKQAASEDHFVGNIKLTLDRKIYLYNFYCDY